MQGHGAHAGHDMIGEMVQLAPQRLPQLASAWSAWTQAQRSAAAQHDAARAALQRLPFGATLPDDVNLSIMMQSIADTGGGGGSVEQLLESDAPDTELDELDEHLATLTSTDDGAHTAPSVAAAGRTGQAPQRTGSAHSMGQVGPGAVDSVPISSAGASASAWASMHEESPGRERHFVAEGLWRPLGESVEAQQAAEGAVGALVHAHDAAAAAIADAAAVLCAWGGPPAVTAEDAAAVTAAAFSRGQGLPDVMMAACAAHERLRQGAVGWGSLQPRW